MLSRLQGLTSAEKVSFIYTGTAASFVGGCILVGAIKHRLIQPLLPQKYADKLDEFVDKLAKATEPHEATKMTASSTMRARVDYLRNVYQLASIGLIIGGLGSKLFEKVPHIPILPACIGAMTSFGVFMMAPDKISSTGRACLFFSCCASAGIAAGPMNLIAKRNNSVLFAAALSSTVAFAVSPLLTRGWIANAFVSFFLSSSLCLLGTKWIVLRQFEELQHILSDAPSVSDAAIDYLATPLNVDGLLILQAIGNLLLVGLHSYPVLSGILHDVELTQANCQRDALSICGMFLYMLFKLFQLCLQAIVAAVSGENNKKKNAAAAVGYDDRRGFHSSSAAPADRGFLHQMRPSSSSEIQGRAISEMVSNSTSMILFFYLYVKWTWRIQNNAEDVPAAFRFLRWVFSKVSPVKIVQNY